MLEDFAGIPHRERVIVALDCDRDEALETARRLAGAASWVKIGMTLYYAEGPAIVAAMKELGFKVFLDLKFHDIPHQVEGAARSAAGSAADLLTVHAAGGRAMMEAAREGARAGAQEHGFAPPALLAITVLTSMSQEDLAETGCSRPLAEQVLYLAQAASTAGLEGVVASPHEAAPLRSVLGAQALIVTPGVRPAGTSAGDQSRVATPARAFEAGASHIVVGRPITQAHDPRAAFEDIAASLTGLSQC